MVSRLADAAHIDGISTLCVESDCGFQRGEADACFPAFFPDAGDMRMAVKAHKSVLHFEMRPSRPCFEQVIEFQRMVQGGMGQCHGTNLKTGGEALNPSALSRSELFESQIDRLADTFVQFIWWKLIRQQNHCLMVAEYRSAARFHDQFHASGRFRAVTHHIPQTENGFTIQVADIGEYTLQCLNVAMNVADECAHAGLRSAPRLRVHKQADDFG